MAGTMLLGGVGHAPRVGFFVSGISTSIVGTFVIVPMTVAKPGVLLPWITSAAALGVARTVFGMRRTERLHADWPRDR